VGLIAREIESRGIATLSLTSAYSITRAVNPPRAAFLDFPLGHTAGKAHDAALQDAVISSALQAFEKIESPGTIVRLPFQWSQNDDWKDSVMRPRGDGDEAAHEDDRSERSATPQYQTEEDRLLAEAADA
jgi:hypothetical protein